MTSVLLLVIIYSSLFMSLL